MRNEKASKRTVDMVLRQRAAQPANRRRMMMARVIHRLVAEYLSHIEEFVVRVTVSRVEISTDMQNATIYVILGLCIADMSGNVILGELHERTPEFKHAIIQYAGMRRLRNIMFKHDKTSAKVAAVCAIIDKL